MENKINPDTERWVEERMALLAAPDSWEPDTDLARARLQDRLSARRPILARTWLPRAAVVAAACLILLLATPTTRAWTQQFWSWLAIQKVEVVQGDFQKLDGIWLVPQMREKKLEPGEEHPPLPPAVNFTEATSRAGFTPRLPREGTPPVDPVLYAFSDPMVWSTTLNVAKMEESLRQAGECGRGGRGGCLGLPHDPPFPLTGTQGKCPYFNTRRSPSQRRRVLTSRYIGWRPCERRAFRANRRGDWPSG